MVTSITSIKVPEGTLAPLDAMRIAATQRQQLHEKILRLRALREASEASIAKTKNRGKNKPTSRGDRLPPGGLPTHPRFKTPAPGTCGTVTPGDGCCDPGGSCTLLRSIPGRRSEPTVGKLRLKSSAMSRTKNPVALRRGFKMAGASRDPFS